MGKLFKLKEIVALLPGDSALRYNRERVLGRIATANNRRIDSPYGSGLFRAPKAAGYATAAQLYDQNALIWAALFFYFTEILNFNEKQAAVGCMPSLAAMTTAVTGIENGESWTLTIENQFTEPMGQRIVSTAHPTNNPPEVWSGEGIINSITHVPLNAILTPILSQLGN